MSMALQTALESGSIRGVAQLMTMREGLMQQAGQAQQLLDSLPPPPPAPSPETHKGQNVDICC